MNKSLADTDKDAQYRSLLQKAVRRGHVDLIYTTSAMLESSNSRNHDEYRMLAAMIAFKECWPFGSRLNFNRKFHSKVAALVRVARMQKIRDASGLGHLAYALQKGDASVYDGTPEDKHIRIVANAIQRPDDFWQWISSREQSERQTALIENAVRFIHAVGARQAPVVQAAAYLALTTTPPETLQVPPVDETFPYWIVFDRHTPAGKLALNDVARDLHIQLPQLAWTCFYFEGSKTNGLAASPWWERRCRWHFQKVGLAPEEAPLLWEPAKQQLIDALALESRQLQKILYRWKVSNLKRVESLKQQVNLFIEHFEGIPQDQTDLFGQDELDI